MEGALPSVVAGLVSVPVIAVPTSVGYGASFGGIAALLGMLNSCANGVAVVNIDNGSAPRRWPPDTTCERQRPSSPRVRSHRGGRRGFSRSRQRSRGAHPAAPR